MIPPRANPLLCGQEAAVAAFQGGVAAGRLPHAWLLAGPSGIGKATFAYRAARWLLAGGETADLSLPPEHPVFRRVAAGTHPDLFTVERRVNAKTEKLQSEIVIDTIREAGAFMRLTPAEGGWRAVVIDGAEDMKPAAANALLKILEEPPRRAVLFLVTAAPGRLLPTLRSRCRVMSMPPLEHQTMAALLHDALPDLAPDDRDRLIGLAEGSIGTALTLAAEGGIALARMVDEALAAPVAAARAQTIADTVTRATDGADQFAGFMALLRAGLAAETRAAARRSKTSLASRVALWQEFGRIEREVVGLNLDKRAAVIVALSTLHGS